MMYTIGHTKNYLDVLTNPDARVFKNVGGYAFLSREEAQKRIAEEGKTDVWSVFGLKATLSQTAPSVDGWWHLLTEQAEVVLLDNENL